MSSSRGDGMYERGKHLAEDLRALTYKYETPIITALQSNREGTNDKMPRLNNMSESMGIGHTADFIFAIWREEEDVETDTTRGSVIKNRFGENFGGCLFETEYSKMKIKQQNEIFEGETEEFENIEKTLEDLSDF